MRSLEPHTPAIFALVLFQVGSADFCLDSASNLDAPTYASCVADVCHHTSLFLKTGFCCWVLVLTPVILATWEAEITVQGQPRQSSGNPHLHNNQSKMDWRCGSSNRDPALQV
jgi:hypothetical protein